MRKHKLELAAIVSLVVLVLLGVTYFFHVELGSDWPFGASNLPTSEGRWFVGFSPGHLAASYSTSSGGPLQGYDRFTRVGPFYWGGGYRSPRLGTFRANVFAFNCETFVTPTPSGTDTWRHLAAPSWAFMPVCLVAPVLWLRRRRRERRARVSCGGDIGGEVWRVSA